MNVEHAKHLITTYPLSELESLDSFGYGWLHATVFGNQLDIARFLIGHKFDVNIRSSGNETPYDLSIRLKRVSLQLLLRNAMLSHILAKTSESG